MDGMGSQDYGNLVSLGATICLSGSHIMTPVIHQEGLNSCISCCLSAMLGALCAREASIFPPDFSKQEMVDCQPITISGTLYSLGYGYVFGRGLHFEKDYPYLNQYGSTCRCLDLRGRIKVCIRNCEFFDEYWKALIVLQNGLPVTAGICIYESFQQYYPQANPEVGPWDIYRPYPGEQPIVTNDGSPTRHAVLIIGYGTKDGEDFFIIKNWSGVQWGYNGYARGAAHLLFSFGYPWGLGIKVL